MYTFDVHYYYRNKYSYFTAIPALLMSTSALMVLSLRCMLHTT